MKNHKFIIDQKDTIQFPTICKFIQISSAKNFGLAGTFIKIGSGNECDPDSRNSEMTEFSRNRKFQQCSTCSPNHRILNAYNKYLKDQIDQSVSMPRTNGGGILPEDLEMEVKIADLGNACWTVFIYLNCKIKFEFCMNEGRRRSRLIKRFFKSFWA